MNAKKRTIALLEKAQETRYRAMSEGSAEAQHITHLKVTAAEAANEAADRMRYLIDKLNEALQRVEAAETTKDAWLAVSWLRTDAWDSMQQNLTKLETLSSLIPPERPS